MTPTQLGWQFEQGIKAVNFLDMPESLVVMGIIIGAALVGAGFIWFVVWVFEPILREM